MNSAFNTAAKREAIWRSRSQKQQLMRIARYF